VLESQFLCCIGLISEGPSVIGMLFVANTSVVCVKGQRLIYTCEVSMILFLVKNGATYLLQAGFDLLADFHMLTIYIAPHFKLN
jgi:hypothetical protein